MGGKGREAPKPAARLSWIERVKPSLLGHSASPSERLVLASLQTCQPCSDLTRMELAAARSPSRSLPPRQEPAGIGHGDLAGHVSRCRAGQEHDHLGNVLWGGGDL